MTNWCTKKFGLVTENPENCQNHSAGAGRPGKFFCGRRPAACRTFGLSEQHYRPSENGLLLPAGNCKEWLAGRPPAGRPAFVRWPASRPAHKSSHKSSHMSPKSSHRYAKPNENLRWIGFAIAKSQTKNQWNINSIFKKLQIFLKNLAGANLLTEVLQGAQGQEILLKLTTPSR